MIGNGSVGAFKFVYDCRYNGGFASQFWDWARVGRLGKEIRRPSFQEFSRQIGIFFGDRADFAETYLKYCRDDPVGGLGADCWDDVAELYAVTKGVFPDELLLYVWQHADWHGTRAFLLDDIARLD